MNQFIDLALLQLRARSIADPSEIGAKSLSRQNVLWTDVVGLRSQCREPGAFFQEVL